MAVIDYITPMDKREIYREAAQQIAAINEGESFALARLSTAVCVLHHAFDSFFWTGFYMVDPEKPRELVVGPYQGSLGCLRIPFGSGVCGSCAADGETKIVDDVHAFDGHIACDSRSNSEIVVPVYGADGKLYAVLDVDSEGYSNFDSVDKEALEGICAGLFP